MNEDTKICGFHPASVTYWDNWHFGLQVALKERSWGHSNVVHHQGSMNVLSNGFHGNPCIRFWDNLVKGWHKRKSNVSLTLHPSSSREHESAWEIPGQSKILFGTATKQHQTKVNSLLFSIFSTIALSYFTCPTITNRLKFYLVYSSAFLNSKCWLELVYKKKDKRQTNLHM